MTLGERVLYHQVHPLTLAADIGSTLAAIPLLWIGELLLGIAVALGVPVIGSAIVLATADLAPIANSPVGEYLRRYMTPAMQAVRLVAGLALLWAAWVQSVPAIVACLAVVALAWANGLIWRRGPDR